MKSMAGQFDWRSQNSQTFKDLSWIMHFFFSDFHERKAYETAESFQPAPKDGRDPVTKLVK